VSEASKAPEHTCCRDAQRGGPTRRAVLQGLAAAGVAGTGVAPAGRAGTATVPVLAHTSEIPVGGGKVFPDDKIVVTRPTKGTYKAFSAVCTHSGCIVGDVSDGTINCQCHGSRFSITDGSVTQPPARQPLTAEPIRVAGRNISRG
jgi:nitrite reductase/ring-hydroxylating ferredoxin subunit